MSENPQENFRMSENGQKVLARIEFTPEQQKIIAEHAGRQIQRARIVELDADQTRSLAPGLLKAAAIVMCW